MKRLNVKSFMLVLNVFVFVQADYFVQLKNSSTIEKLLKLDDTIATSHHLRPLIKKVISFGNFEGFSGDFTKDLLEKLKKDPLVKSVSNDFPITIFETPELVDTRAIESNVKRDKYWGISTISEDINRDDRSPLDYETQFMAPRHLSRISRKGRLPLDGPFNYYYDPKFNGKGVYVYVIDTGIYKEHPDFDGRAIFGANVLGSETEVGDLHGHGTHVAGVIGSKTFGVAKGVTIVEVKALNKDGSGTFSSVIAGLEFAVKHRKENNAAGVVNLSLGSLKNDIINTAIKSAVDSGLVVVVAGGNSAMDSCLTSPASAPDAITVGAIDDRADILAYFSNFGQCSDIFASGVDVESLSHKDNESSVIMSGTSMSSPGVAGLSAILLQKGVPAKEIGSKIVEMSTRGKISEKSMRNNGSPNRIIFNGITKADDEFPNALELADKHFQDNYKAKKVNIDFI